MICYDLGHARFHVARGILSPPKIPASTKSLQLVPVLHRYFDTIRVHLLLRRRHCPICNGLSFLSRNGNFTSKQSVTQVLDFLKTEPFVETHLQALLIDTLKHKTQVLEVLLHGAIVDVDVVEVERDELL
jgi:hypothetical protein